MTTQHDPRITELIELAIEEGRPLAVQPATVCALEDAGWLVEPFTGQLWREDPRYVPPALAFGYLVQALQRSGLHPTPLAAPDAGLTLQELTAQLAQRNTPCTWSQDALLNWNADCGGLFAFAGSPHEEQYLFCPACGRPVAEQPCAVLVEVG